MDVCSISEIKVMATVHISDRNLVLCQWSSIESEIKVMATVHISVRNLVLWQWMSVL